MKKTAKPTAIPMPVINVNAQTDGYVTVHTNKHMYAPGLDIIVQQFWRCCLDEAIASAHPWTTKEVMFKNAQDALKAILDKGARYCILLQAAQVREGLSVMGFSTKPQRARTFATVCRDFAKWWEENPDKRDSHVLAEYLL